MGSAALWRDALTFKRCLSCFVSVVATYGCNLYCTVCFLGRQGTDTISWKIWPDIKESDDNPEHGL